MISAATYGSDCTSSITTQKRMSLLGKGWMMLMNCLSVGRSISLPAVGTGAAKFTSLVTGQYAQVREQFNVPLAVVPPPPGARARRCRDSWRTASWWRPT